MDKGQNKDRENRAFPLEEAIFIYNAVNDGWTVSKESGEYKLTKQNVKNAEKDKFNRRFVEKYLRVNK